MARSKLLLEAHLKALRLPTFLREYDKVARRCAAEGLDCRRFFTLREVAVTPKPAQKPAMPIWVGGRSHAAARRAGRLGDGWLVSSATPAEVREGAGMVFATALEHGRQVHEDHVGALVGFHIAATAEEAASLGEPCGHSRGLRRSAA